MYSIGGWKIRPGSCNSGFKSAPSTGTLGRVLSKGDEVKISMASIINCTAPKITNTLARIFSGKPRLNQATMADQPAKMVTHNSKEPS